MRSRRVLGAIAMLAVVAAVMSFAMVDMSTSAAEACARAAECDAGDASATTISFAVGVIALLVAGAAALTLLFVRDSALTADADLES